jgi:DNA-binding PadR family transcriptional regulator
MSYGDILENDLQSKNESEMDVKKNLPLSEAAFLILLSLAPQPRHGYGIMKEVTALSDGRVQLSTGTLYGALKRLLDHGWVERFDETVINGRKRKAYRLTDFGRRILDAETARLQNLVHVAQQQTAVSQS